MTVQPQVGKSFETANGRRATVQMKLEKPDVNDVLFVGIVKLNGQDQMCGWTNAGVCPSDATFNLDSLWPADDSRQYQPIIRTDEGIYRAFAQFYAELGSLKHDWLKKGVEYALKLERSPEGPPTAEIVDLK